MYYVYLIRSINDFQIIYVGYTANLKERLATHNSGGSIHTKKDRPWELVICMAFKDMDCAKQFEKYLKSQSGRAFVKNDSGNDSYQICYIPPIFNFRVQIFYEKIKEECSYEKNINSDVSIDFADAHLQDRINI